MDYYMKTRITGVGSHDAGTSEFSNLKTGTLETGTNGGFSLKTCNIVNQKNCAYLFYCEIPNQKLFFDSLDG
jgi:hypothetical protein